MVVCTDNISTVGLNSDLKHAEDDILLCVAGWRLKSKYWKHPSVLQCAVSLGH